MEHAKSGCLTPDPTWRRLQSHFFDRPATSVAPELVGCYLSHETDGQFLALRISEVEIYSGEEDTACHASRGKTKRRSVLYERAGTLYVYLCYGVHHLLNIVTGPEGYPEAILIRACTEAPGPGRLTRALGITTAYHGRHLDDVSSLAIWTDGCHHPFYTKPRVGIDYASEADRRRRWRYCLFCS